MPAETSPPAILTIADHRRDSAGMTYVYPVVSRRAGGVSIGINLNPNNACNWRCIYCQVPDLRRGGPPPIDLALLERELRGFLDHALHGSFLDERVPVGSRRIADVAFSGNGEPTSAAEFADAVAVVAGVLADLKLDLDIRLRLITNGSLIDRRDVQQGLALIGKCGGEVWFKVDTATAEGLAGINGARLKPAGTERRLARAAALCPTWVQTCLFRVDGVPPGDRELDAYLALLARNRDVLVGVQLYSIARPPMQPHAERLSPLTAEWLEALAGRIAKLGLTVNVSP